MWFIYMSNRLCNLNTFWVCKVSSCFEAHRGKTSGLFDSNLYFSNQQEFSYLFVDVKFVSAGWISWPEEWIKDKIFRTFSPLTLKLQIYGKVWQSGIRKAIATPSWHYPDWKDSAAYKQMQHRCIRYNPGVASSWKPKASRSHAGNWKSQTKSCMRWRIRLLCLPAKKYHLTTPGLNYGKLIITYGSHQIISLSVLLTEQLLPHVLVTAHQPTNNVVIQMKRQATGSMTAECSQSHHLCFQTATVISWTMTWMEVQIASIYFPTDDRPSNFQTLCSLLNEDTR